ncbi:glycosyltransferase [Glutamicibacter ectropisis]|uniref:Glycosyltransferase n=1 Tax=Glutamicibacter ectropisis TaxID=3046593 RepID=A0AAU6WI68_9MICC
MSKYPNRIDFALSGKTILCVVDEESVNPHVYRRIVAAQIASLRRLGAEVVLLHVAGRADELPSEYRDLDVELLVLPPIEVDSVNERSRKLAQRAVKYGAQNRYDVVIGFGWTLSRGIAGGRALAHKYWAFIDDSTDEIDRSAWTNTGLVDALYRGSRKVFVFSDERRSILENTSSAANGRTYLPALSVSLDGMNSIGESYAVSGETVVILPGLIRPSRYIEQLSELSEQAKSGNSRYRFIFDGAKETWADLQNTPSTALTAAIPGLETVEGYLSDFSELTLGLVPETNGEEWLSKYLVAHYLSNGIAPISMDRFLALNSGSGFEDFYPAVELANLGINTDKLDEAGTFDLSRISDTVGASSEYEQPNQPVKIVLAGADFKFAGDLVELLNESPDFELRIDLWENNAHPNAAKSAPFVDWADIVICEFASFNAIWYAQNKREGQKLIVRLHGYELLQPWIDQLEITNVDQVVFVSEFYRQKAIDTKNWPESKTSVVSNTVDFGDLARTKFDGAEFHLGMAGYVPILKRPDRALDLLEELLKYDDRFILHMRGHEPWNYSWEWKKGAHQAAYRDFYSRIADNDVLRSHISFEAFGPDMAGWFRKIGWMLSPSYRETFHLAPVEGMASGALPVVWERDGADEIFPSDFVISDVTEAAQLILGTVADKRDYLARSLEAQEYATRYSRSFVKSEWVKLILSCQRADVVIHRPDKSSKGTLEALVDQHEANNTATSLLNVVAESWRVHDYATAISLLDANIKITANDKGDLKQWEHWVRGVFQTAMGLESLLLDQAFGCVYEPNPNQAVVVTGGSLSQGSLGLRLVDVDTKTINIQLPFPGVEDGSSSIDSSETDEEYDFRVSFDGSLRSNYYVAQAASEIASILRDTAAGVAVSSGGLIESLATLLATRRVGIPFLWSPASSHLASEFLTVFDEIHNDDPVHEIYQAILTNANALVDSGQQELVVPALKSGVPLIRDLDTKMVDLLANQNVGSTSNHPGKLSVAYAGDGTSVEALSLVSDVTICTNDNVFEVLDNAPDAFVLEYSADPSSKSVSENSAKFVDPANINLIQKAILHSRVMGARSIFIAKTDPDTLAAGKEIARKCDVLVSNDRKSLISYMRLNPNSNQVAVNIASGKTGFVEPRIDLASLMASTTCDSSNSYAVDLERGLSATQPVLSNWRADRRWSDSNQVGKDDTLLRYEASGSRDDGIAALWLNCYELSQGRTALDFAVYVLRSAGFAVAHARSHQSLTLLNKTTSGTDLEPDSSVIKLDIDGTVEWDDALERDLLALYRVTGTSEITVQDAGDGYQEVAFLSRNGQRIVNVRRSKRDMTDDKAPAKISDFANAGVSVVVATYKGVTRLPRLLGSIVDQTLPASLMELIVVPNGDDDGTVDLLEEWSQQHRSISLRILPLEEAGVAKARNLGIANASKDFVTFVDDDDYLEPNFLLSLYSRAESHTVVLGNLSDVDEETGTVDRDTATNRRVNELGRRVLPLAQRAGALGMNGAKLLPTWLVRECVYDPSLRSGEDVAFMAQLLKKSGIFVTSASDVENSSYMRVLRFNSISRRQETFEFMVTERLEVMRLLLETHAQSEYKGGKGAIDYLATGQLGFLKRFIAGSQSIAEHEKVLETIDEMGLTSAKVLQPLISTIRSVLKNPASVQDGKLIPLRQNV